MSQNTENELRLSNTLEFYKKDVFKECLIAGIILFLTLLTHLLISFFSETMSVDLRIVGFLLGFVFLVFARYKIISYRIKKGYFANNASEAKELILFILKNNKKRS